MASPNSVTVHFLRIVLIQHTNMKPFGTCTHHRGLHTDLKIQEWKFQSLWAVVSISPTPVVTSSYFHAFPPFPCRNWHRAMCPWIHHSVLLDSEECHVPTARSAPEGPHWQRLRKNGNLLQLWIPGHAQDRPGEFYKDLLCQHWMRKQPFGMLIWCFSCRAFNPLTPFSSVQLLFCPLITALMTEFGYVLHSWSCWRRF